MTASRPTLAPEPVERTAARWFARWRSGEMTDAEVRELQQWLEADADHRLAYDVVARAWVRTGLMRTAPEVLQLRARHRQPFPRARRFITSRAMAASLAVAVLGLGAVSAYAEWRRLPDASYSTGIGEQRTIKLRDGSVVILNTDSVVRTRRSGTQRLIYLDKGQALFKVAHDRSRPFIVTAAGRTVTALGTSFDVRIDQNRFEVVLVEGRVKVETPVIARPGAAQPTRVQATELIAGSQFVAVSERDWRVAKADAADETEWATGWLRFEEEPLGQVVQELSRYSTRRIVIADPELEAKPVSGRFRPENIDAFVRALDTYHVAQVTVNTPTEIRLAKPDEKTSPTNMGG